MGRKATKKAEGLSQYVGSLIPRPSLGPGNEASMQENGLCRCKIMRRLSGVS